MVPPRQDGPPGRVGRRAACPSPGKTSRSPAIPAMPRSRKTASTTPSTTPSHRHTVFLPGSSGPERCTGQSRPGWSALAAVAGWARPGSGAFRGHPPFTSHPYRRPLCRVPGRPGRHVLAQRARRDAADFQDRGLHPRASSVVASARLLKAAPAAGKPGVRSFFAEQGC